MRTRIALAAATAATSIIGSTLSLSQHSAATPAGATKYDTVDDTLAAFHEAIPTGHGATDLKPLTNALLVPDGGLFGATGASGTAGNSIAGGSIAGGSATTAGDPTAIGAIPVAVPAPPPPPPPPTDATSTATTDWQCIRVHESGDEYNDPGRPSGAYGILVETWRSFGYSGWPYEAAPAVQDALALRLYAEYGWQPWSTRYVCGL
jgi:hypothetical protein